MKAGTAARLVYAIAVVAVIVVAAAPSLSMLANIGAEQPSVGTESVYVLEYMDEETLCDNIRDAVSGTEGCSISYGGNSTSVDPSDCSAAAAAAKSSGEPVAKVVGPDGNVLRQESIAYRNPVIAGAKSGIDLSPGSNMSVDLMAVLSSDDGKVRIVCDSGESSATDGIDMEYIVPLAVYNIAAAYGCDMGVRVSVDYTGLGRADISVMSESLSYASEVSCESGSTAIEVRGCMASEYGAGKVGSADMVFLNDGGESVMRLSCEGRLSEVLEASLEDGCLTVSLNGASYTMGSEMSAGFIAAVEALEGRI